MAKEDIKLLSPEAQSAAIALSLKFISLGATAVYEKYIAGPLVETFYFKLAPTVPLAKILGKGEDMAFATGRESAVIIREGGLLGVQLARLQRETVDFNQCLFALADRLLNTMRLPILLGKNYQGEYEALDLADEPHALVAGSTGSGKSMFLLSAICTLCIAKKPEELRLFIVDSKQLDLAICAEMPHVSAVCRNAEDLHKALDTLHNEMRRRNSIMSGVARNIDEYNQLKTQLGEPRLPRLVLVIDEFADIIEEDYSLAKAKVQPICSYSRIAERLRTLAQLSRASGIHIIAATQRPSVKITSGDLKVNLPCRIAFRLTSSHDSKTVLKEVGAENLLGMGDMLVESSGRNIFRAHAPFVTMATLGAILSSVEGVRDTLIGVAVMQGGGLALPEGS